MPKSLSDAARRRRTISALDVGGLYAYSWVPVGRRARGGSSLWVFLFGLVRLESDEREPRGRTPAMTRGRPTRQRDRSPGRRRGGAV